MGGISIWHIVILVVAVALLFGWKNLPNMARSMGESMRVFKTEVDQMKDDGNARKAKDQTVQGELGQSRDSTPSDYEDSAQREYREAQERRPDGEPRT